MKILISWIGRTDLTCASENEIENIGPIAQALKADEYSKAFLLCNYSKSEAQFFSKWVKNFSNADIAIECLELTSPTNHKEIYTNVRKFVSEILKKFPDASLVFHTSPGTPAMALTWMLLAPVFGAKLIESSKEAGVQQVALPFEISAYFLPDKDLALLAHAKTPAHTAFSEIIYQTDLMKELVIKAQHVASRNITVLIEGESGTGKEVFARAIHNASMRSTKPFKAVNCGAFPSELIESILFGYEKGTFTGATTQKKGLFHEASGGTLFLDELGELSQKAQVALLRVLQEGKVTRVGGTNEEKVDVRIIAATNRNLIEEVGKGNFRSDLFYRIAVACLHIPPLRKRKDDIPLLLEDATRKANKVIFEQGGGKHKIFSDSAKKVMQNHPWHGNVRELYNTVTRAILWASEDIINEESAKQALFQTPQISEPLLEHELGNGFSINDLLDDIAISYIQKAEKEAHGNKTKASKLLGFKNYQTFTNWQKKYKK